MRRPAADTAIAGTAIAGAATIHAPPIAIATTHKIETTTANATASMTATAPTPTTATATVLQISRLGSLGSSCVAPALIGDVLALRAFGEMLRIHAKRGIAQVPDNAIPADLSPETAGKRDAVGSIALTVHLDPPIFDRARRVRLADPNPAAGVRLRNRQR